MALTFRKLHRHFVGESSPIELRNTFDPDTLAAIRAGMDEYAVRMSAYSVSAGTGGTTRACSIE